MRFVVLREAADFVFDATRFVTDLLLVAAAFFPLFAFEVLAFFAPAPRAFAPDDLAFAERALERLAVVPERLVFVVERLAAALTRPLLALDFEPRVFAVLRLLLFIPAPADADPVRSLSSSVPIDPLLRAMAVSSSRALTQ